MLREPRTSTSQLATLRRARLRRAGKEVGSGWLAEILDAHAAGDRPRLRCLEILANVLLALAHDEPCAVIGEGSTSVEDFYEIYHYLRHAMGVPEPDVSLELSP